MEKTKTKKEKLLETLGTFNIDPVIFRNIGSRKMNQLLLWHALRLGKYGASHASFHSSRCFSGRKNFLPAGSGHNYIVSISTTERDSEHGPITHVSGTTVRAESPTGGLATCAV
jgi:hypothetical protein